MKVQRITIENVGSLEQLELEPGTVTVLEGRNGVGKSSVLLAIEAVISGGHDPSVIRSGADKAVVTIALDDGTQIRRSVTQKTSSLQILTKDGDKKAAPKTYLEGVIDAVGFNPARFLDARPAERLAMLLSALPLDVNRDALARLIGDQWVEKHWPIGIHPLDGMARVRKAIFDERTVVNRLEREKAAHAEDLRKTLPTPAEGDARDALSKALAESRALEEAAADRKADFEAVEVERIAAAETDHGVKTEQLLYARDKDIASLEAKVKELQEQIAKRRERHAEERNAANAELAGIKAAAKAQTAKLWADYQAAHEPKVAAVAGRVGELKERLKAQQSAEESRRRLAQIESERSGYRSQSETLSAKLGSIDEFREAAISKLPIPGVEVVDGEVYLSDPAVAGGAPLPWARVNRARQVRLAVEVARQRAGELGLIVLDEAECLDAETWREFLTAVEASGTQMIAARVSDHEALRVTPQVTTSERRALAEISADEQ